MRNAVKTVGRLAKEKSRTAYREVRSKFKDMQINRELEGAAYSAANTKLRDKPRSAPSSPKFSSSDMSANQRRTVVSPSTLTHQINSNFIDRNHSLRRCETSVSQHYHVSGSSPGYPTGTNGASSSSDESGTEDELNMIPLNLNLMDDMKDILAKTASSASTPPAIDRSVITFTIVTISVYCLLVFQCLVFCADGCWFCFVYFIISFFFFCLKICSVNPVYPVPLFPLLPTLSYVNIVHLSLTLDLILFNRFPCHPSVLVSVPSHKVVHCLLR